MVKSLYHIGNHQIVHHTSKMKLFIPGFFLDKQEHQVYSLNYQNRDLDEFNYNSMWIIHNNSKYNNLLEFRIASFFFFKILCES